MSFNMQGLYVIGMFCITNQQDVLLSLNAQFYVNRIARMVLKGHQNDGESSFNTQYQVSNDDGSYAHQSQDVLSYNIQL